MPECPPALEYLWKWFDELSLGLSISGMAPPNVTWDNLLAWAALRGHLIEDWEALVLVQLGALRAGILAENSQKKEAGKK